VTVTVYFVGVVTHFPDTIAHTQHTVLVDASAGMRLRMHDDTFSTIPRHSAQLTIPMAFLTETPPAIAGMTPTTSIPTNEIVDDPVGPDVDTMPAYVSWILNGVSLTLDPPGTAASVTWDPDYFNDVPSLTKEAKKIGIEQLEVDDGVATDGRAAAYFDASRGNFSAAILGQAAYVRLDLPSDALTLYVTQMDQTQTTIALQSGMIDGVESAPWIVLSNTGVDSDVDIDFLLHYDVTTWTPDRIITLDLSGVPAAPDDDAGRLRGFTWYVTLGCSNSNYP
jgi:hypothetical protein